MPSMATAVEELDKAAIMAVLETVPDPEIPVLTITDLGIVRGIVGNPPRVQITPTYTGCPATLAIEQLIREALDQAGFGDVYVERQLFPPSNARAINRLLGRCVQRRYAIPAWASDRPLLTPFVPRVAPAFGGGPCGAGKALCVCRALADAT